MAFNLDWKTAKFGDIGKVGINERDDDMFTPLHDAVRHANLKFVLDIIRAGADINAQNKIDETPLHRAVFEDTPPENLLALLKAGADINAEDNGGKTPLHLAAIGRSTTDIISTLVDFGANVNAQDTGGETPLHIAADGSNQQIAEKLLELGSNPKIKNARGSTAYDIMLKNEHLKNTDLCRKLHDLSVD